MSLSRNMPIGKAIAFLKKEISERQAAVAVLEALVTEGVLSVSDPAPHTPPTPSKRGRPRSGSATTVEVAADIVREAGRPLHGLREILPALEKRGYAFRHRASLAGSLMKSGKFERVAPGTFALKRSVIESTAR